MTAGQALALAVLSTSSALQPTQWPQGQWLAAWYPWNPWGFTQPSQTVQLVMGASEMPSASAFHPPPEMEAPEGKTSHWPMRTMGNSQLDHQGTWQIPTVPASSSSSPDEAIMGPPQPVPQDDAKAHQELLKRVSCNLGLQAEELEEPSDSLFDVLCSMAPARVAFTPT